MAERGLDFEDARFILTGKRLEFEDCRQDYGETRIICYGYLDGRMVVVGYVEREDSTHIFSMRKANAREKKRFSS
ncbi:MAG: BrnT family toxin [Gammaproteobacteria bacterium]